MKKFWKNNGEILKFVIKIFSAWLLIVNFLGFAAPFIPIPQRDGYNYVEVKVINPSFLWNRANFDGIHYLDIARKGYGIYQQAFFPLFPTLIRNLTPFFGGRDLVAGLFISWASLFMVIFLFYKLLLLDYSEIIARKGLLFLIIFPTSFFFSLVYTESFFLFLVLISFYAARRRKWLIAGIFGGLASYTRLVGIFLFPALIWEWWLSVKWEARNGKWGKLVKATPLLIVPLGLLFYMRFLWQRYGDPLLFIRVQPFFGAERSGGKIILLYQVFWRYFKMILTTRSDPLYFAVWLELLSAVCFLFLLILALYSRIRLSYLIFTFLAYLTPSFSGTFSSFPRYSLVLFPAFLYLGTLKNKTMTRIILVISGILFIISATLFFKGYWVA